MNHNTQPWTRKDSSISWGDVEWIHLVQDRDHWRAVVNVVMNLQGSCATELVSRDILHLYIMKPVDSLQCSQEAATLPTSIQMKPIHKLSSYTL
jgi:hypothetical protein